MCESDNRESVQPKPQQNHVTPPQIQAEDSCTHDDKGNGDDSKSDVVSAIKQAEWPMIILTAVIALFTAANVIVYWCEAESASKQAQKLIEAANIQACAAAKSAKAASDLAGETKSIAERALTQVGATNALATQAKRSADISKSALENQERPWIGLDYVDITDKVEVGSRVRNALRYSNWGNGPALRVAHLYQMGKVCGDFPTRPHYESTYTTPIALMPKQPTETGIVKFAPLTSERLAEFNSEGCGLYVYAKILYQDRGGHQHWRHVCAKWTAGTDNTFESCPVYNDGDEDYKNGKEPQR